MSSALRATAAILAGALAWIGDPVSGGAQPKRSDPPDFDLAVRDLTIAYERSTPMFRDVSLDCIIENRGPDAAPPGAKVIITRITEDGTKTIKSTAITQKLQPGETYSVKAEASAWHGATVPFRCSLDFGPPGALKVVGDRDASDDLKQVDCSPP